MAAPGVNRRGRGVPPAAVIAVVLAVLVVLVVASVLLTDPGGVALSLSYGLAGAVLAIRRPNQPIAWLLLLMAAGLLLGTTMVRTPVDILLAGAGSPIERFAAWANGTGWAVVFGGLLGLILLFPSGRLGTRWERRLALVLAGVYVPLAAVLMFGPTLTVTIDGSAVDVPNPYALAPVVALAGNPVDVEAVWPWMLAPQVVAIAAFLWRFRHAAGLQRMQFRWLAWAVVWVAIASALWALVTAVLRADYDLLAALIVLVSYPTIPAAVVIAVTRYRLYDIDRLLSRTLGWGIASATIVAVFAGGVLALQAALSGITQGATLAVAASTLLAFALFQPVRRRVQALVDRRFDRPRLEAERILVGHGERLRQETDLERIEVGVLDTVSETLRPSSATVWIRHSGPHAP